MTDYLDRITKPTPGDALELYMREMDRGVRKRHPGAFGPPDDRPVEDTIIGPAYPPHLRKLMHAYGGCGITSAMDHEQRAKRLEELVEAAMDAAHAEWKLARGEVRE